MVAVLSKKFFAKMPVGGMQYFHNGKYTLLFLDLCALLLNFINHF